jgi:hypothetical protein
MGLADSASLPGAAKPYLDSRRDADPRTEEAMVAKRPALEAESIARPTIDGERLCAIE